MALPTAASIDSAHLPPQRIRKEVGGRAHERGGLLSRPRSSRLFRLDFHALAIWALTSAIVLYLSMNGGGYDIVVRSQTGIVVWWIVLVGAVCGGLPASLPARRAGTAVAVFGAFVAWSAIASTWSLSIERSLQEVSRVLCYLGILILGIAISRDREHAVRHTGAALATSITVVAVLALISRLRPDLIPSAQQTASFLPGAGRRLSWPLNYWNALGALMALGIPLLLGIATSSRRLPVQAGAAAAIPLVGLCAYLTFSRGAALAAGAGVAAFFILSPSRVRTLASMLSVSAGTAVLIVGALHREATEHGLATVAAQREGATLALAVIFVCSGVGLLQAGIGLVARHGTLPRSLSTSVPHARLILVTAIVIGVTAGLLAGGLHVASHTWQAFKHPTAPMLHEQSIGRFGSASGNGRYDYWKVAINAAASGHIWGGLGPGTFQLVWLPRAPYSSFVENAHSLYVETLSDTGIFGLALLGGFLVIAVSAAISVAMQLHDEPRIRAAGVASTLVAFCVSAAVDWIWQVPALPAVFMLLAASVLMPDAPKALAATVRSRSRSLRVLAVLLAAGALGAIAVPLAVASGVRSSQSASRAGQQEVALRDALNAARVEPGAASPRVQAALVLELQGHINAALAEIQRGIDNEPENWSSWLIKARLEAEAGHAHAALRAFRQGRSLNPKSPIFRRR